MTIVQAPAEVAPQLNGRARLVATVFLIVGPVLLLLAGLSAAANNAVNAAASPAAAGWVDLAQFLAVIFMVGWGLVVLSTTRRLSPVAAWTGFGALTCQLVGLAALTGMQVLLLVQATQGMDPVTLDRAMNDGLFGYAVGAVMFICFLPGLVIGLIAMSVATWRSPWVPRAVPVLLAAVLVLDVVLPQEPALYHLGVFVPLVVASGLMSAAILRDGAPAPISGRHTGQS